MKPGGSAGSGGKSMRLPASGKTKLGGWRRNRGFWLILLGVAVISTLTLISLSPYLSFLNLLALTSFCALWWLFVSIVSDGRKSELESFFPLYSVFQCQCGSYYKCTIRSSSSFPEVSRTNAWGSYNVLWSSLSGSSGDSVSQS